MTETKIHALESSRPPPNNPSSVAQSDASRDVVDPMNAMFRCHREQNSVATIPKESQLHRKVLGSNVRTQKDDSSKRFKNVRRFISTIASRMKLGPKQRAFTGGNKQSSSKETITQVFADLPTRPVSSARNRSRYKVVQTPPFHLPVPRQFQGNH
jgi:hypothetical protein